MEMDSVYMVILNIPPKFHSSDLRNYFSAFSEQQTYFSCFHFRHRPQLELVKSIEVCNPLRKNILVSKDPVCCIVKCSSEGKREETIKKYHLQNWVDTNDNLFSACCIVGAVIVEEGISTEPLSSMCLDSTKVEIKLPLKKIKEMIELKPPLLMPKGNIGTSTKHFLTLINACRLPSSLIGKLGLNFPKTRSRKYGQVPFNYGNIEGETRSFIRLPRSLDEAANKLKNSSYPTSTNERDKKKEECKEDDDEEQEWDRHEALHDDVTEQERNKERLYEEEMEVVWEKGGPGIVWYTDAQRWKEAEGDFDEQTTDDWDVDYSVYFEENGGDKDARDLIEMRRSTMWRQGTDDSVFKKPPTHFHQRHRIRIKPGSVGPFEQHTKGIGRRLMEKQGWRDGAGLGRFQKGISKPIESEGQKPKERKGLGYFGERIPTFVGSNRLAKAEQRNGAFIATVYDRPANTDPPEPLLRRNQPTAMKYRYA